MGVRLYPRTTDPRVLEMLAEVPKGTMRRLNGLKAKLICTKKGIRYYHVPGQSQLLAVGDYQDYSAMQDAELDRIFADDVCCRLDHFLTDGWGKLHGVATSLLEKILGTPVDTCGQLDDPKQMGDLLFTYGVDITPSGQILTNRHDVVPLTALAGLYWC